MACAVLNVWQRVLIEFLPSPPSLLTSSDEKWPNGPPTLPRNKPMNVRECGADWYPEGSSYPNKLMWVMRVSILTGDMDSAWLRLVQSLNIFSRTVSPVVKKIEGGKIILLSDSGVCLYFVLVSCQPLHAWLPWGLRVFTATWLETYRGTDKVWQPARKDYSGTRWRSCFCLSHHQSPYSLYTSVLSRV